MVYLICVDGSEESNKAVDHAARIVRDGDTALILHVLPPKAGRFEDDWERTEDFLQKACNRFRSKGIKASALVQDGAPAEEILRTARQRDVDTIVVGRRGRGGRLGGVLLGSVSDPVVNKAEMPVLVVH